MKPTPIWMLPQGFNISEIEGREAFQDGLDIQACPYGESVAGNDWRRGWNYAANKAKA